MFNSATKIAVQKPTKIKFILNLAACAVTFDIKLLSLETIQQLLLIGNHQLNTS